MKIDKKIIIETKNLRLRIPLLIEIEEVYSATQYEGFNDGMLWEPPNDKNELIEPFYNGIKAWEEGKSYGFTIENKKTTEFLGRISIRKTKIEDRWSVGFWTHPNYQKKGIMTEALGLIIKLGFENLNAKIIEAEYAAWNLGSKKVLERNGMKFIKHTEQGFKKKGKWIGENLVMIEKEEWQENMKTENWL